MKSSRTITILLTLLLAYSTTTAQAEYPTFNKAYWENEQDVAQGKITRGVGLGIAGLILIWPTAVMISRTKENPHKYIPLSIVFGAASIGAMSHGFASISAGKDEKATASYWVDTYTTQPDSLNLEAQQDDYLNYQQESARKSTVFGVYTTSIAAVLLTNGIIQSSRSDADIAADDISIWPYYAAGGALLPMGIVAIIKSRQSSNSLDELAATPPTSSTAQFMPFVTVDHNGRAVFGAFYSMRF